MASAIYPKFKEALLTAGLDVEADTIKATLIDTADYTYSSSHQYMNTDTVPAAAKVGSPATLSNKTITNGLFDNTVDTTYTSVTGDSVEALIIWKDGGGGGTSASGTTDPLIAYIEFTAVTPNGGDITITWNGSGIFQL